MTSQGLVWKMNLLKIFNSGEMENKFPDVLEQFKKGNLPEDGLKSMVTLAKSLTGHYVKTK